MWPQDGAVTHDGRQVTNPGSGVFRRRRTGRLALLAAVAVAAVMAWIALRDVGGRSDRPDLRNGRSFIQDNLWTTERHQYAVWVGPGGVPLVGQRDRDGGTWQVEDLGELTGNPLSSPTDADLHNVYSIGVDADGYVHVAGNMHAQPLRYVRTRSPHDITRWQVGELVDATGRVTYPSFAAMPDGTLLFFRRQGVPGESEIVLDAKGPGEVSWQHRGAVVSGLETDEGPYLHRVAVDGRSGAIHLLIEWRSTIDPLTTNDVTYARSTSGGRTWERSDGTRLPTPVTHTAAEVVIDTPDRSSGLLNGGGLTIDGAGRPHAAVTFRTGRARRLVHVWRTADGWRRQRIRGWVPDARPAILTAADGRVWLLGSRGRSIEAFPVSDDGPVRFVADAVRGWEPTYDSGALHLHGEVQLLVPTGSSPEVVRADLAGGG